MSLTLPTIFTKAHRRALEWLPEDGSWRTSNYKISSEVFAALHSLETGSNLVEGKNSFGIGWRLTPAGVELMKKAKENPNV